MLGFGSRIAGSSTGKAVVMQGKAAAAGCRPVRAVRGRLNAKAVLERPTISYSAETNRAKSSSVLGKIPGRNCKCQNRREVIAGKLFKTAAIPAQIMLINKCLINIDAWACFDSATSPQQKERWSKRDQLKPDQAHCIGSSCRQQLVWCTNAPAVRRMLLA